MMSNRKDLIEKLKQTINKRESTSLITEQVEHYIGSDMTNETLEQWVSETIDNTDPVCSDDVLSLWDVGRFNNREILIDMIRNNLGSYSEPSIKRFLSSLCSIEPDITVSGIGVHTTRDFDDIDENDEESTCPYNVKIKTGNFELSLKMLFEFNGGWQLTRKNYNVQEHECGIISFGQFDTPESHGWSLLLENIRSNIEHAILENDCDGALTDSYSSPATN